ncbi:MAG: choice-of-anchor V domain-containing protein [Bacteroidota bacterium]
MKKLLCSLTILTVSIIALSYAFAHANYTGRTMMSGTAGCGGCHASVNSTVQVSISGPDTLSVGKNGTYQVRISGGSGSSVCADIAASAGTLAPADANLKLSKGELITNGTKRYSGGSYTYSFVLTAPASAQTVTLYATGDEHHVDLQSRKMLLQK